MNVHFPRRALGALLVACGLLACAAEQVSSPNTAAPGASGEAFPPSLGVARSDLASREHDVAMAGADCEKACKALGSMERAADHLCALSGPDECADARVRVDRARRAVDAQCGGC